MLGLDWALLGGFAMYLKFFIPNTHHVHDLLQGEAELELNGVGLVDL